MARRRPIRSTTDSMRRVMLDRPETFFILLTCDCAACGVLSKTMLDMAKWSPVAYFAELERRAVSRETS